MSVLKVFKRLGRREKENTDRCNDASSMIFISPNHLWGSDVRVAVHCQSGGPMSEWRSNVRVAVQCQSGGVMAVDRVAT